MLSSSVVVDHGFDTQSGQTKDYEIGICCFSVKNTVLERKNKDGLVGIRIMCLKWSDMSNCRLLFQWASTIKIQLSLKCGLVQWVYNLIEN